MMIRVTILFSILVFAASGQKKGTSRIVKGDTLSTVYATLGTPVMEYPLKGQLVQEYRQCTIVSRNEVVVSATYKKLPATMMQTVKKEEPTTIEEIKEMASQGDAEFQYLLAYCFHFGKAIEQDYDSAVKWYRSSAMQGFMPSQHNMGFLYMNGKGVPQNNTEAYMWALLAAENGNGELKRALEYRVSPEEKLAAKRKAVELKRQMKAAAQAEATEPLTPDQ